jgi:hypothetical protein
MVTWTPYRSSCWLISTTGGILLVSFYLSKILSYSVHLDPIQVKPLLDRNNWRNTFGKFYPFKISLDLDYALAEMIIEFLNFFGIFNS